MKKPEYIVAAIAFIVGMVIFSIDTPFKFGEYSVYALFAIGIPIAIYQSYKKPK